MQPSNTRLNLGYRHQGSEAESLVRRSAELVRGSRTRLAATEAATWDHIIEQWRKAELPGNR